MSKLVSVIMSIYNEDDEWLHQSIKSILNQTYSYFEFIIVIDNPDNEHVKRIVSDYKSKDDRIKVILNEKNLGLVASLNRALEYCNGYYVARMDADDISYNDRFEKQIKYLENNNLDCVMSYIDKIDENGNILAFSKNCKDIGVQQFMNLMKYCNIATHPTWLMKKDVYSDLKGYRNINKCEDYDFMLRALQAKYNISKMKDSLLFYRVRKSSITQKNVLEQYYNSKYLRKKYQQNTDISKLNKVDIEKNYCSLNNLKIENFYHDYACFKTNKILCTFFAMVNDAIFRNYIIDNLKITFMIWKNSRR